MRSSPLGSVLHPSAVTQTATLLSVLLDRRRGRPEVRELASVSSLGLLQANKMRTVSVP